MFWGRFLTHIPTTPTIFWNEELLSRIFLSTYFFSCHILHLIWKFYLVFFKNLQEFKFFSQKAQCFGHMYKINTNLTRSCFVRKTWSYKVSHFTCRFPNGEKAEDKLNDKKHTNLLKIHWLYWLLSLLPLPCPKILTPGPPHYCAQLVGKGGGVIELLTPTGTLRTPWGIQGLVQNRAKLTKIGGVPLFRSICVLFILPRVSNEQVSSKQQGPVLAPIQIRGPPLNPYFGQF